MKENIICTGSTLAEWTKVLVDDGWKIIEHTNNSITGKKSIGQSRFPVKNATTWYITVEDEDEMIVTFDVPAFTDSLFSRHRIYDEFGDITEEFNHILVKTDTDMNILEAIKSESFI